MEATNDEYLLGQGSSLLERYSVYIFYNGVDLFKVGVHDGLEVGWIRVNTVPALGTELEAADILQTVEQTKYLRESQLRIQRMIR